MERNSRPERDVSCADSMVAQPCRGVWISMDSGVKTNTLVTYIVRMVDHTLVNNHQWPPNNSWTANTCPCPKVAMLLPSPICDPPTPQRPQNGQTSSASNGEDPVSLFAVPPSLAAFDLASVSMLPALVSPEGGKISPRQTRMTAALILPPSPRQRDTQEHGLAFMVCLSDRL